MRRIAHCSQMNWHYLCHTMTRHAIFYLLVFSSMAFAYKKLSDYDKYNEKSKGGIVFKTAPDGEFNMQVFFGKRQEKHSWDTKIGNDIVDYGDGFLVCDQVFDTKRPKMKFYRFTVHVVRHADELGVELDDFMVDYCEEGMEDLFKISDEGSSKYSVTFKDNEGACFTREIEITDEKELTVMIDRKVPEKRDCSTIDENFKTKKGAVQPQSWIKEGKLLHDHELQMFVKSPGKARPNVNSFTCRKFKIDDQVYNVVDLYYLYIPIDRMVVISCSFVPLQTSLQLDGSIILSQSHVVTSLVYHDTEGECYARKYDITVNASEKQIAGVSATVVRQPRMKVDCPKIRSAFGLIGRPFINIGRQERKPMEEKITKT